LVALAAASLFVGKYPLSMEQLAAGDAMQWRVFLTLRCSRTVVGIIGGFALGVAGFVYQTVFGNPLASPDIIGVSSGASAGAAAGILFLSGAAAVTASAFAGALLAVVLALALSSLNRSGKSSTIVLAGIAVHSLAQTALMCLKLTADPERELASIEYWMMGSLNGISAYSIGGNLVLCVLCMGALFLLHRQIILLSAEEGEARMLGVRVPQLRLAVLLTATLAVSSVVSLTGLISFVGLLAPHGARLLTGQNRMSTMLLSGLLGGVLLCGADILARSMAAVELPVSIFTSILGAPFLIVLIVQGRQRG
jgi:iron complex transport system permease protein